MQSTPPSPLVEPDVQISRIKCCRQHLMRYVAKSKMWPSGCKHLVLNIPALDCTT
jgi:hypothetical protein